MAHHRKRYLLGNVNQALSFSPLVGVMGHRQVGKTTLLQDLAGHYVTFDNKNIRSEAKEDSEKFLKKFSGLKNCIDECQLVPDMFPALKEHVRQHKRPGQFLLSGSVRFTSRNAIKESLTGRIVNLELLPFSISELRHFDLPQTCLKILDSNNLKSTLASMAHDHKRRKILSKEIEVYYERGGLPGVCFIRDKKLRKLRILEQLNTILDRDIRLVYPTSLSFDQLFDYLAEIAKQQGVPYQYSHYEKKIKISQVTQHKLLYALESIFLIRRLVIQGGRGKQIIYLEDQAEAKELSLESLSEMIEYETMLYRNIRTQFAYSLGLNYREWHYLTRGGARVPFAFQTDKGTLGILPTESTKPSQSELASAGSFLRKFNQSKVIMVPKSGDLICLDDRIAVIPASLII